MERLMVYCMSKFFTADEMDQMERLVSSYLNKNNITLTPPVDIFRLATDLGFDVRAAALPREVDGMILVDETAERLADFRSNKVIAYNSSSDINKKKFIVAHELAHYISQKSKANGKSQQIIVAARDLVGNSSRNSKEQRMDYMAAALLMPRDDILKRFDLDKDHICETLATYYRVDSILAKRRIEEAKKCQTPRDGRP